MCLQAMTCYQPGGTCSFGGRCRDVVVVVKSSLMHILCQALWQRYARGVIGVTAHSGLVIRLRCDPKVLYGVYNTWCNEARQSRMQQRASKK